MSQVLRMIKRLIRWFQGPYEQKFPQYLSLKFPSIQQIEEIQIPVSKGILWLCLALICALLLLPKRYFEDVNSFYFKGLFAFVICVMFSFAGAFSALLLRNMPNRAVLRRCYFMFSVVSMTLGLSILTYAWLLDSFGFIEL